MYVHVQGRLGVMFVYVLGEMCMRTGSLPIEPNKKGHVDRGSFVDKDSTQGKLEPTYLSISFSLDISFEPSYVHSLSEVISP